jgi:hypothetical protein
VDVDDEEYARALLAILTNPTPEGIDPNDPYGQAADGIDRYDGFGREVVVTSVRPVGGEHGTEFAVGFELVGAPTPVPPGEHRVLGDAGWRELSGYADPAAHAPRVAHAVMSSAHTHYQTHRDPAAAEGRAAWRRRTRAALPSRAQQWRLLLDALGEEEGVPVTVAPGRIEVRAAGAEPERPPELTLLVTPDQWEDVLVDHVGADLDVSLYVAEMLSGRDEDEDFVVFYRGDLARSIREELPPVRGRAFERRIARIREEHPGVTFAWAAFTPET